MTSRQRCLHVLNWVHVRTWEDNSKTSILAWFSEFWIILPLETASCTQDSIFWLMMLSFPEEFGGNPPSSLFIVLYLGHQIHWQQKQSYSIILPPYLTAGVLFLWFQGFSSPNMSLLIVAKQLNSCFCLQNVIIKKEKKKNIQYRCLKKSSHLNKYLFVNCHFQPAIVVLYRCD